jgi:hypothetical protein
MKKKLQITNNGVKGLNSINQLIFVIDKCCAFFEEKIEFLNII